MNILKREHSCIDITEGESRLVIDPGSFAQSLTDLESIDALVITHVHPDHFDEEKVQAIIAVNPNLTIFSTTEVATKLSAITIPEKDHIYEVGDFKLEFFGEFHAQILPSIPLVHNFGVLVNEKLYYTGDSYTRCPKPHTALGITVYAPWMKLAETVEFIERDSAKIVFPCHDGFLNDAGKGLVNGLLKSAVEIDGKSYITEVSFSIPNAA